MFHRIVLGMLAGILLCTTLATGATKSDLCARVGEYSDTVVANRDAGLRPTQSMANIDRHDHKQPDMKTYYAFMRWIVLYVYKYPNLDAAWLRQQVEIACLEHPGL